MEILQSMNSATSHGDRGNATAKDYPEININNAALAAESGAAEHCLRRFR